MNHIIVNEEEVLSNTLCISAYDRGLTLGHGLFETMLFNKGSVSSIFYHWERLLTSADLLGIKIPFNFSKLESMINRLIIINDLCNETSALRLTITDGISERGLLSHGQQKMTTILTASRLPEIQSKSMTATIVNTRRNEGSLSSKIKSISYLDNILAKKEALSKGYDEAILLNSKCYVAEGSISNIFMVKNNAVYTPPIIDGALPGITRYIILNKLTLDGIEIKEKHISVDMLLNADEIFISNSLMGVKSINKLNDLIFDKHHIVDLISKLLRINFGYI
jgi:branched-chain amino acid aminotransferase